jgi:hypothetical protein
MFLKKPDTTQYETWKRPSFVLKLKAEKTVIMQHYIYICTMPYSKAA